MTRQGGQVTLVEIRNRAEQGLTHPFYCKGDDHKWYWVKGNLAGKQALCCEWLAGRIGKALGLPIPPFAQVMITENTIEYSAMEGIAELGSGWCFGSQHVETADEFSVANIASVDQNLRNMILAFDWWIQNGDRILGPQGGNVNLLWTASDAKVHVIDHNVSFNNEFDIKAFKSDHVFSADLLNLRSSFALDIEGHMRDIVTRLQEFWEELPEKWIEDATLSPGFSFDRVKAMLDRFQDTTPLFGGPTR